MRKIWFEEAWEDYLYWQTQDKKTLKRINALIKDVERDPFAGIGKPEGLKYREAAVLTIPTGWCTVSGMVCWKSFPAAATTMIEK